MANSGIFQKTLGFFPDLEMIVRRVYRFGIFQRVVHLNKFRKNPLPDIEFDFNEVIECLKQLGVGKGDILIVHSAYKSLKPCGLSPEDIINSLLSLVGDEGTLVMPVIRQYSYNESNDANLATDLSEHVFEYDVKNSKVWTGIIPNLFMQRSNAVVSRFPLNTLAAIGSEAENMMQKELEGELQPPNGLNSPWKYCMDKNAWVVSLGTDLTHSLTMIHTAEDTIKEAWPVRDWYRPMTFKITDGDVQIVKTVLERHPKWGMFHFGERKLCHDLLKSSVMSSSIVKGVLIETVKSQSLMNFLAAKNQRGYPYFWLRNSQKNKTFILEEST